MAKVVTSWQKIDKGLQIYYESQDKDDYKDDDGNGKFMAYCEENGFEEDDCHEELYQDDPEEIMYVEFDEEFPFPDDIDENSKNAYIVKIIRHCYENGVPPSKSQPNDDNENKTNNNSQNQPKIQKTIISQRFSKKADFTVTPQQLRDLKVQCKEQIKTLYDAGMSVDDSLLKVMAMGRRENVPFLQHMADAYARARIEREKDIPVNQWTLYQAYFKEIQKADAGTLVILQSAIKSFYHRVCPKLQLAPMTKIQDKYEHVVKYIEQCVGFVTKVLNDNKQCCPFQVDFMFAFAKATSNLSNLGPFDNDDGNDTDDTDDTDDGGESDDMLTESKVDGNAIGNVKLKLKKTKSAFVFKEIDDSDEKKENTVKSIRAFDDTYRDFCNHEDIKKNKEYPRKKRFCAIIDRRPENKEFGKKKNDELIFYETPYENSNTFPADHMSEWYLNSSKECILPPMNDKGKSVNSQTAAGGSVMTLSFHVEAADTIRCYLYLNGQMTRFLPEDILKILPKFFDMKYENNDKFLKGDEIKQIVLKMNDQLKDEEFAQFYQLCNAPLASKGNPNK